MKANRRMHLVRGALPLLGALASLGLNERAAGQSASDSAAIVARQFLDAFASKRWQEAALLFHPETLAEFKRREVGARDCWRGYSGPTAAQFMKAGIPRAVAEYNAREARAATARADSLNRLERRYPGTRTVEELRALAPVEFIRRRLMSADQEKDEMGLSGVRAIVLGGVPEGEWVNVLFRYESLLSG